ncbi:hypothetical protein [Micromonospora sp. WMMD812]|uniref:hypothetical protein n=1 Tax=Micromonospora sp. WMMD812 TaxID=3015152 RepID=UPI00248AD049|nr:hypothetical protein [Micromonospora sp. WMMD812]WBB68830.1 hypothetical protein O7603_05545 [Micromonospora sp. WMMD812]
MTDLEDVIESLLFRPGRPEPLSVARSVERLDDGTFHVDYDDADHVYLVTVRQVPRLQLPVERPLPVGEVAGVGAQLVRVAVANHVEVTLDAEPGAARAAATSDFTARHARWEAEAAPGTAPPPWPAEQFGRITITLSDDVGTRYRVASGQDGGPGTEWTVRRSFRPTPPVTARRLTLDFSSPTGPSVRVDLPLPS